MAGWGQHWRVAKAPAEDPCSEGLVGQLESMCSDEEAQERVRTRQLDRLEWAAGASTEQPEGGGLHLATKRYQRSAAHRAYTASEVRTVETCRRTMVFLMSDVLELDLRPNASRFAACPSSFADLYDYMRNRTRAVRVDLQLQEPRVTASRTFIEVHEWCLRFELLALALLSSYDGTTAEGAGYDQKLGLNAISQSIDPLLNAYRVARALSSRKGDCSGVHQSPHEPAVHRYVVLLLASFAAHDLPAHLAKLSPSILNHRLVRFAVQAATAYLSEDYSRFLALYRKADFPTAAAMSRAADHARIQTLAMLARAGAPSLSDRLPLSRLESLLALPPCRHDDDGGIGKGAIHTLLEKTKVSIGTDANGITIAIFPKRSSPEAASHPLLCGRELPHEISGPDPLLESKLASLGMGRADIVFGLADPK
eukprot:gnl/TRDRNA2_/TRDRNA2_49781_c0_seq1.p1 gnl/TRDRNA2_/TRDRNA2_49781_c0~~gnl/TRDRNA2_/TRDRNA2_49781_c0_seq1.p1  ORF type:complete len:424 (+),score=58.91 gnl/TRDRNA2_/TRDRNA2_49781_c0_seq1:87-1358(+)